MLGVSAPMSSQAEQIEVELADVQSVEQLHELLAEWLEFPHYYGKNWDAFWDIITEPYRLPHLLRFTGWTAFQRRLPEAAQQLQELLRDAPSHYSYIDCSFEYA